MFKFLRFLTFAKIKSQQTFPDIRYALLLSVSMYVLTTYVFLDITGHVEYLVSEVIDVLARR